MENYQDHELQLDLDRPTPTKIRVVWRGQSTGRAPGMILRPWFDRLYAEAQKQHAAVELDFLSFEHFNSSTIAALVHVINAAREKGVPLTVRYDRAVRWQSLSFEALERAIRPFEKGAARHVEFIPDSAPHPTS
ncbi:MAG: hypothetical protein IRZ16_20255 [Myxococcaceae bacterium]|nr:hypothetical protein [Myxococcaceae bacterium]